MNNNNRRFAAAQPVLLYRFVCCAVILLHFFSSFSQCAVAPAFPGCTPAGSTPLTDGAVINAGTTMTFSGTATYANVTVNGGRLIVCGNLSITNFTVNSGVIWVNTGATLNYNGGGALVLGSGTSYYNWGTSLFAGHVLLNANVTVINDWYFATPFNYIVVQGLNAWMVNNYRVDCGGFMAWIPSSPACLCLGGNSWTTGNYFYNRTSNSVVVPSGSACLNIRQYASNDYPVSPNPGLSVCVPSGISYSGLPNWGSATVNTGCNGCLVTLPIELLSFDGRIDGEAALLEWVTMSETNNCRFFVERSQDAVNYNSVGTVNGAVNSTSMLSYRLEDPTIAPGQVYYYRLRQQDCDGHESYSSVISLEYSAENQNMEFIEHNSGNGDVQLMNTERISEITVYAASGQLVMHSGKESSVDLSGLSPGIFLLKIVTTSGKIKTYTIQKL